MNRDDLTPAEQATSGLRAHMLEELRDATLGEYEILMELGSGGMATVYLAHDIQLDRKVAIKLMHPSLVQGQDMVERFLLEARTAAKLTHASIVPIYAVKVQEELLYFVMQYIEGRPLDSIIRAGTPIDTDTVRHIVIHVAEALAFAHRHGVIHRDVKPANIIISTDGHPVLADFGIAKVSDRPGLTMTGATIGTPTYMSPEQCDAHSVTGASDQYSLGVTAYEMLTGKPPFDAPSYMGILLKHMTEVPAPLREVVPQCPADLATAVERMLAKEPEVRFPNLEQVVEALTPASAGKQHRVRTQLVQFALSDPNRERISRLSVPVSPIPTGARRARGTTKGAAPPDRRTAPWAIGALVLAATAVGGLLVGRPWERRESSASPTVDTVRAPTPGPAMAPQAAPVPSQAVQPPPATTATPAPRERPAPGQAPVQSAAATVASLRINAPDVMPAGSENVAIAEARNNQGGIVAGKPVTWSSSDPAVLSVDGNGRLRAHQAGQVTITATSDGTRQSATITVQAEPVAAVAVTPSAITLAPGGTAQVTARVTGSSGRVLERPVAWTSSDPSVATVDASGRVQAVAPGSATISGRSGERSDEAGITVTPAPGPAPATDPREQVTALIAGYARALERADMARIRELYPSMPASTALKLQEDLSTMSNRQFRLVVRQLDVHDDTAVAWVTGAVTFTAGGKRDSLPADNRYHLERRGSGWIITDIR